MKSLTTTFIIASLIVSFNIQAQCDQEALLKTALTELHEGQYIRDFKIDFDSPHNQTPARSKEYSVVLNGSCQYIFKMVYANSNNNKVIMQLYDNGKIVGSNVGGGKIYDIFGFICKSTKMYKLVFSYKGNKPECTRAILALQKQFTEKEMGQ